MAKALTSVDHDPDIRVGVGDVGGDGVGSVEVPTASRVGREHERGIGRALKRNKDSSAELSLRGLREGGWQTWMNVLVPSMPLRLMTRTAGLAVSMVLMLVVYKSMREALLQHG